MNIYFPAFIPLYVVLVLFLMWWASSLAFREIDSSTVHSVGKVSWHGVAIVIVGFAILKYVEYSKRYQYKAYTRADVLRHNSMAAGVWLIVNRDVYDVTDFVKKHPAGAKIILQNSGKDATKHYDYHLEATKHFWRQSKIGWIIDEGENV